MSFAHLRPLTAGEILDGAFVLYRRHLSVVLVVSLLPQLPLVVLWTAVAASVHFGLPEPVAAGLDLSANLAGIYGFVAVTFALAALIHVTSLAMNGEAPTVRAAYAHALRRFPTLLVASVLAGLAAVVAAIALIIPGIAVLILATLTSQVVVVEGAGASEAISRSMALSRPEWRRVSGVVVVCMLTYVLPSLLLQEAAAAAAAEDLRIVAAGAALDSLLHALVYPVFAIATTLLYYDCRVRGEALDLQAAAADLPVPA